MSNSTDKQIADVMKSLQRLVEAAKQEGRNEALAEVRSLVGGDGGSMGSGGKKPPGKRGRKPAKETAQRAKKNTKSGKPRKNP